MSLNFEQELHKFSENVLSLKNKDWHEVETPLMEIMKVLFEECEEILSEYCQQMQESLSEIGVSRLAKAYPDSPYYYHFNEQLTLYSRTQNLSLNRLAPRGWFKITFVLPKNVKFRLVFSLFYTDNQNIAIMPFFEILEKIKYQGKKGQKPKDKEHEIDSEFIANGMNFDNSPMKIQGDIESIRFEMIQIKNFIEQNISNALQVMNRVIENVI